MHTIWNRACGRSKENALDTEDSLGTFSPLHANGDDYERWITKVEEGDRRTFVAANRFWAKHFNDYTNSVTRRIELWCRDY